MPQVKKSIDRAMRRSWNALPKGLQANVRPLIHSHIKPVSSSAGSSPETSLLSVIVPVYNVRKYIEKCLESILSQDYKNLEVIVVDDGSTDGSDLVVEAYMSRHKRVRMLRVDHSGNGTARNVGIQAAKGKYLTFVDSDDIVEPGAYTTLINQLTSSGSDFAVGAFYRQKGSKKWLPQMMSEIHGEDRIGITVDDFPEILRDVFLWNKVFVREFWSRAVGSIPEGVLYEDQETIVRAFLRAASFDVLQKAVYTWRIREDNSSITQQKGDLSDLIDRMRAALIVTELVESEAKAETKRAWYVKSLGEDLRLYIDQVPQATDAYWDVLQSSVSQLYAMAEPEVFALLPVADRVVASLVSQDRRSDLENVLVSFRDNGRTFPVRAVNGMLYAEPVYVRDLTPPLPSHLLQFGPVDTHLKTRLLSISWIDADTVEVRGAAYIQGLDASEHPYKTHLELLNTTTGERLTVPASVSPDPWIDQVSGDRWNSYAECVFSTSIKTSDLLSTAGKATPNGQEWNLLVTVDSAGITETDVIRVRDGEKLPFQLPTGKASKRSRVVAQIDRTRGLRFRVIRYGSMASGVSVSGRTVKIRFEGSPNDVPKTIYMKSGEDELSSSVTVSPDGRTFAVELPVPPSGREVTWDVYGQSGNGKPHFVGWPGASIDPSGLPPAGEALSVSPTGYGYLRINVRSWRVTASDCTVDHDSNAIVVTGTSAYLKAGNEMMLDLILATPRSYIAPQKVSFTPGSEVFTAIFPLSSDRWGYGDVTPEPGHYKLYSRTIDEDGTVRRHGVRAVGALAQRVPAEHLTDRLRVVFSAEDRERSFVVKVLAPYRLGERGPFAQQQLRTKHLRDSAPIDTEAVLFESFGGKSVTDSVRAISDELGRTRPGLKRYWTIADYSVRVPEGCTGVLIYSAEWYRVLNTAGTLVNNNNFPHYFRKREGQIYVQTWHGTPLKKIGNHTPLANLSASYRRLMEREAKFWDVLIAQNKFAGETLPRAFGYHGNTVTEGYPRNDVLHDAESFDRRSKVRSALGLNDDTFVILYTPTWRDNVRNTQNKFDVVNYLDYEEIADALGSDYRILSRGHHNVAGQRKTAERSTYIDVTAYPEIADLYLAADLMITDYSSSMFDYCGTKKPIIFLAPDIDQYENETRGFYFNFRDVAPGPILSSTSEVIDAIRRLDSVKSEYRVKYSAFVATYAALDDGKAAQRILNSLPAPATGEVSAEQTA